MKAILQNEVYRITINAKEQDIPSTLIEKVLEGMEAAVKPKAEINYKLDTSALDEFLAKQNQVVNLSEEKKEETKSRPKAVALKNSERNLTYPIAEKFPERWNEVINPEPVKQTPEKVNVGVKISCPTCGREGTQVTYRGNRYAKCWGCDTKLFLRPAGETWGDTDEEGNEYTASELYIEEN